MKCDYNTSTAMQVVRPPVGRLITALARRAAAIAAYFFRTTLIHDCCSLFHSTAKTHDCTLGHKRLYVWKCEENRTTGVNAKNRSLKSVGKVFVVLNAHLETTRYSI